MTKSSFYFMKSFMEKYKIISSYKFFKIPSSLLKPLKKELFNSAESLQIKGLALISQEGLNVSFSGKKMEGLKNKIQELFQQELFWKEAYSSKIAFKRLSVKIKKEVINIGEPCQALEGPNGHLTAQEWESKLKSSQPQILDVRNDYEIQVGRFKKSKSLGLNTFQEFPEKLDKAGLDKKKDTLIYCTGGIRCEKAIQIMKQKGFKKVYQLEGGILNYLKEFPNSEFEEECFVFDHRTALNQKLEDSKRYSLCPHCGQAGDQVITCKHCEKIAVICESCKKKALCSKNCAYHYEKGHVCRKKNRKKSLLC